MTDITVRRLWLDRRRHSSTSHNECGHVRTTEFAPRSYIPFNIGAYAGDYLVGAVRVLTDGYFFATIPEIIIVPEYQRREIGRALMARALARAPRGALFFGAQADAVGLFERTGCTPGPTGFVASQGTESS